MVDESLAFADVGLTVAREPRAQGARRQRVRAQGPQEAFGVIGIGARQWDQDPDRRPGRDRARAHALPEGLGEPPEQLQSSIDPTDVASEATGQFVLGQALALVQLAHEQRLLECREGMGVGAGEHGDQRVRQVPAKGLHSRGIPTQPSQGRNTPIAIDQDQTPPVFCGDRKTWHELTTTLERATERLHGTGYLDAQAGIAQVQAVQVEFAVAEVRVVMRER